jgi:uncharacterized damage-inducible protein DinB
MLSLDYIRMIWDYNYWGHHKLLNSLMTVSAEDFAKPIPYSIGSLNEQVVHTMWAEALWLTRIKGQPRVEFGAKDYASLPAVRQYWTLIESDWRNYIASLTENDLDRSIEVVQKKTGQTYNDGLSQILLHLVNHGTDHRAQMLRIIHDFGGETFEQDMIYYFRELKPVK